MILWSVLGWSKDPFLVLKQCCQRALEVNSGNSQGSCWHWCLHCVYRLMCKSGLNCYKQLSNIYVRKVSSTNAYLVKVEGDSVMVAVQYFPHWTSPNKCESLHPKKKLCIIQDHHRLPAREKYVEDKEMWSQKRTMESSMLFNAAMIGKQSMADVIIHVKRNNWKTNYGPQ